MFKRFKLLKKIKKITLVLLDVDGVMTDEGIYFDDSGVQIKKFNAKDGFGIKLAIDAGIKFAFVTGKKSKILKIRAKRLGVHKVYQGEMRKHLLLEKIKKDFNVKEDRIAFVADDIFDISLLNRVSVKVAVKNASREVKAVADYITRREGGKGGVRDFLEFLLKRKGIWKQNIRDYY